MLVGKVTIVVESPQQGTTNLYQAINDLITTSLENGDTPDGARFYVVPADEEWEEI